MRSCMQQSAAKAKLQGRSNAKIKLNRKLKTWSHGENELYKKVSIRISEHEYYLRAQEKGTKFARKLCNQ